MYEPTFINRESHRHFNNTIMGHTLNQISSELGPDIMVFDLSQQMLRSAKSLQFEFCAARQKERENFSPKEHIYDMESVCNSVEVT